MQLSDHFLAKQIDIPRIPQIQTAYEPKAESNLESTNLDLIDFNSPHEVRMVSPGIAMYPQSFSSGEFNLGVGKGIRAIFIVYIFTFDHDFSIPLLILETGHGNPAGDDSCYDVLDRELGEISREIEEDHGSQTTQFIRNFQSQPRPGITGIANDMSSMQSIGPLQQGGASTSSIAIIHHVRGPLQAGVAASNFIK